MNNSNNKTPPKGLAQQPLHATRLPGCEVPEACALSFSDSSSSGSDDSPLYMSLVPSDDEDQVGGMNTTTAMTENMKTDVTKIEEEGPQVASSSSATGNVLTSTAESDSAEFHAGEIVDDSSVPYDSNTGCRPLSPTGFEPVLRGVMGDSLRLYDLVACPCCHQAVDHTPTTSAKSTLNEPNHGLERRRPLFRSLLSQDDEEDEDQHQKQHQHQHQEPQRVQVRARHLRFEEEDEDRDVMPGVLAAGVCFTPTRVVVEGMLHKKGTGKDWFGSRAWKPRWAKLVFARMEEYEYEVPLLLIYWYPSSAVPSTVIALESTVVLAFDLEDQEQWNAHRFEIRHASTRENKTIPVTRTFAAARKARDAWVYAISNSLLTFEKDKARAKRHHAAHHAINAPTESSLSVLDRPVSPIADGIDEIWRGDRFSTVEIRTSISPPSSPQMVSKHVILPEFASLSTKSAANKSTTSKPPPPPSPRISGSPPRPKQAKSAPAVITPTSSAGHKRPIVPRPDAPSGPRLVGEH